MLDAYMPVLIGSISSGFGYLVTHKEADLVGVIKSVCISIFVSWAIYIYTHGAGWDIEKIMLAIAAVCLVADYAVKYAADTVKGADIFKKFQEGGK